MAVRTISELKALWINGFIADQDDYVDLFDTIEALGGQAPAGGGVAVGLGDFDPNGSEDPNDPSGETIIVPQEVTDFINENPNKELLWLGSYTGLDGYNFGLHILKYVVDDPNDPSQNFWEEILTPTPQVFQVVRDVTTLPTSFQPANQYLYSAGVLNDNQTGIYNGSTEITLNLSESGDNLDPFGNVTIQRREIRNAGDGAINFVSQNSSLANVANVFVPNGKEPKISGKGVVVITHTHDVASDTSTYILSGDLDDTPAAGTTPETVSDWTNIPLNGDATALRSRYRTKGDTVEVELYILRRNTTGTNGILFFPPEIEPTTIEDGFFVAGYNVSTAGVCIGRMEASPSNDANRPGRFTIVAGASDTDACVFTYQYKIM